MHFAVPQMLWLLLASPILAAAGLWVKSRKRKALSDFAGGSAFTPRFDEQVSLHRRSAGILLFHAGLLCAALALARPQWGSRMEPVVARGADIVVVLDSSLSMAAEDAAPQRLGQAKHAIASLVDELGGDRVALVTFAGEANLSCPLTVDHAAVELFLDAVEVDTVPVGGTALADALGVALSAFSTGPESEEDRGRAVVVFSDGEDHEGGLDETIAALRDRGVPVYAVGCGTPQGAPLPLRDLDGTLSGYKKDRDGRVVTSRLDESVLERLALETGGRYYRATDADLEVRDIAKALGQLSRGDLGTEIRARYQERFQVPLLGAWLAWVTQSLLGDRRRNGRVKPRDTEVA